MSELVEQTIVALKGDPGMYVSRAVVNEEPLFFWAAGLGFLLDDGAHCTIAFSRKTVSTELQETTLNVPVTGYGVLGKDNALVLFLDPALLEPRWQELQDAGATWDYEGYQPHITICYLGSPEECPEWSTEELPDFPIVLGPEKQTILKSSEIAKINVNHRPAGTRQGGQFAPKTGTGYSMVGGTWQKANGSPAPAKDLTRLKEIGAAGGHKDVRLNPDKSHYLQALATDAKGRRVGYYSSEYKDAQKQAKFKRNEQFHKARPGILNAIETTLKNPAAPHHMKEAALALKLIDRTGFRPGSDKNTKAEKKAFGATTLQSRHVKIEGNTLSFNFVGKKGVKIAKTLKDPELAAALRDRVGQGGRLFPETTGSHLKAFLTEHGYGKFMPKDFRTWNGTSKALETIKSMPVPTNATTYKKAVKAVSTIVARHLGNTPAMAFNSYINPRVWHKWPPLASPRVSKMDIVDKSAQSDMDELFDESSVSLPGPMADMTDTEIESFLKDDGEEDDEEDDEDEDDGEVGKAWSPAARAASVAARKASEHARTTTREANDASREAVVDPSKHKAASDAHITAANAHQDASVLHWKVAQNKLYGATLESYGKSRSATETHGKMASSHLTKAKEHHAAANGEVGKVHDPDDQILKVDDDQRIVWGWASVSTMGGELVQDHQNDVVTPEDLQKTAHDFMMNHRVNGRMHKSLDGEAEPVEKVKQTGAVVESIMFTKELQDILGIDLGMEAWLIGVKVTDDDTWAEVKKGTLRAFSIGGSAERVPLEKFNANHGKDGRFSSASGGEHPLDGSHYSTEHEQLAYSYGRQEGKRPPKGEVLGDLADHGYDSPEHQKAAAAAYDAGKADRRSVGKPKEMTPTEGGKTAAERLIAHANAASDYVNTASFGDKKMGVLHGEAAAMHYEAAKLLRSSGNKAAAQLHRAAGDVHQSKANELSWKQSGKMKP